MKRMVEMVNNRRKVGEALTNVKLCNYRKAYERLLPENCGHGPRGMMVPTLLLRPRLRLPDFSLALSLSLLDSSESPEQLRTPESAAAPVT